MAGRDRKVALLVAGCLFMETLDGTIVTTAIPQMASSLGESPAALGFVITSYLMTIGALIPLSGWLATRIEPRSVFLVAIVVFVAGSIGCAASDSLGMLVAMRVLQGVGGALMFPVGRLIVLARTPRRELMRATSYLIWPALIAPVFAPLLGGLITTYASWHWIFLVNVPLGALAFALAVRLVPRETAVGDRRRLDRIGAILACGGLAGLTYAAHLLSEGGSDGGVVALISGVSAPLLVLAFVHMQRTGEPLIELGVRRTVTFGQALWGGAVFILAFGAVPFLLALLFQEEFGWSPVKSGAIILFVFAGNLAIKPATTAIYGRIGFRRTIAVATASFAVTAIAMALFTAATPIALIVAVVVASGFFRSVGMTGYTTMAFADVSAAQLRDANTLQATAQQLALGLSVAVAAIALQVGASLEGLSTTVVGPPAFAFAFVVLAGLALLTSVAALRISPDAADLLRRRR